MPASRRSFLAAVGLTAVAGCLGDSASKTPSGPLSLPTADERLPLPASPERLRDAARSGGPSKDGIPSIDDPQFVGPSETDFLADGDPVFGVVRDDVAKAYPQKILAQHEIVNDTLAGTPVSVTYCPLTGTVQGFERGNTTFGVSGRLINSNLVMYDRHTETWWPQMLATLIPGPWNADPKLRSLREFRLLWTTWKQWRDRNPETRVLSTNTGHAKNYSRDPYGSYDPRGGYYADDDLLFPALNGSDRFGPKRVVMGLRTPSGAAAFPKDALREAGQLNGTAGDTQILAVYDDRYDTGYGYLNPESRSFERDGNRLVDGAGTAHEPDTLPLARVHTFDSMWFAWAGYYPETDVAA